MASSSTYLRVKRPRHVPPPSSLCIEGLVDSSAKRARPNTVENLANLLHQSTYIQQQQQQSQQSSNNNTAIWKRVNDNSHKGDCINNQKRSYVNAVLNNVEENDDDHQHVSKRRRLSLTLVPEKEDKKDSPVIPKIKKKRNVILDPNSRLVQESLEGVISGHVTIAEHLRLLTTDSRLCDTPRVWLAWEDVKGSGNILHACSLWNNIEGATSVLSWNVPSLLTAVNEHGQTPYQVAVAVKHDQAAQVIQQVANVLNQAEEEENEDDYVYDVFELDTQMNNQDSSYANSNGDDHDSSNAEEQPRKEAPMSVELRGGIGYWTEEGNLVLEALDEEMMNADSDNQDDDEDSNCEDYFQNDYPDEEDVPWDDDSDSEEEVSFRHRPIYFDSEHGARVTQNRPTIVEEPDEEYDAQYDMYEPSDDGDGGRLYAYDSEHDNSDDE